MDYIVESKKIPVKKKYDIIVAGGGVAGISAALSARRQGKSVLLLEKSCQLGGLATLGQINLFVPMCNGHGRQIVKGMNDEMIRAAVRYGYDTTPQEWKKGEPLKEVSCRYALSFSACMFALALNELLFQEKADVSFDTLACEPVMENGHCQGLIVENKSGRQFYRADMVIDATGDADILYRAGVPTVTGINYFSYFAYTLDLAHCKKAAESGRIDQAVFSSSGGCANLFGKNHPNDIPFFNAADSGDVNRYLIENQLEMLKKLKKDDPNTRQVIALPGMCQFRTSRRLDGDYTLHWEDCYSHFEDSITAVNDFEHRDYLWEVPYRTLVKTGFDNLLTAGRTVSAAGYAWDIMRVIPPAIVTGQAAGLAAAQALDEKKPVFSIAVSLLQKKLAQQNVLLHFEDSWIGKKPDPDDFKKKAQLQNDLFNCEISHDEK